MNTLEPILHNKRLEVEERKSLFPVKLLERSIFFKTPVVSLKKYLLREDASGIIAEIKRKSPSKGALNPYVSIERTSIGYMQAGASALSILTDQKFFGGTNEDLTTARKFNFCPILRKEFILDEYQIIETKSIGADAILLMASVLESNQLKTFCSLAHSIGLEVLVEVHDDKEITENEESGGDMMGVNNRDLKTLTISIERSKLLSDRIPDSMLGISESGIESPQTVVELRKYGYVGFLMGQVFMEKARPENAAGGFIRELRKLKLDG